jgi:hypothetical protein
VFEPDSRVVLLDQLRPPVGYRLEAAVATTFTLHLGTALVAPLAFASHEMRSRPDPIAALEAVRACADRVDIFCQAGQIALPTQASDLMAFLEPMVHPVARPRPGFLFHPKIWFLRYVGADLPDSYRLICSTRNLVDSHAWDAVISLEGSLGKGRREVNAPLAAFLRQLPRWAVHGLETERLARVLDLADKASRIRWTPPDTVSEVRFHAFGVPRVSSNPDFRGYRHLVISPFCNDWGVDHVTAGNRNDVTLVSRPEELDRLSASLLTGLRKPNDRPILVLDPLAGLETPSEGEGDSTSKTVPRDSDELTGLHAKITIAERNNRETHVFVGSANATTAAYDGNVEFVVELIGRAKDIGVETVVGPAAPFRDLLQPYAAVGDVLAPPEDEELHKLEKALREIAAVPFEVNVASGPDGYELHLTSTKVLKLPTGHALDLGLLTRRGVVARHSDSSQCDSRFAGVPLADITPFITLRLTGASGLAVATVIRAHLQNDPPDRLDEVLARQVDSRQKFLRFLALLLNLRDPDALFTASSGDGAEWGSWGAAFGGNTGVFELVLSALADRPESLLDLDRLVTKLRATDSGREILPEGFSDLWSSVISVLTKLKEPL